MHLERASSAALARTVFVTPQAMVGIVAGLERKGFIRRKSSRGVGPRHRRHRHRGRQGRLRRAVRMIRNVDEMLAEEFTDDELAALERLPRADDHRHPSRTPASPDRPQRCRPRRPAQRNTAKHLFELNTKRLDVVAPRRAPVPASSTAPSRQNQLSISCCPERSTPASVASCHGAWSPLDERRRRARGRRRSSGYIRQPSSWRNPCDQLDEATSATRRSLSRAARATARPTSMHRRGDGLGGSSGGTSPSAAKRAMPPRRLIARRP